MPLPEPPPCGGGGCQDEDIFVLLEFFSVCVTFFCSALFSLASFSSLKRKAISFAMAPSFDPIEAKMRAAGLSDAAVSAFKLNFDALAGGESGRVRKEEDERRRRRIEEEEFHGDRGAPWLLLRAAALFEASFRSSSCSTFTLICLLLTRSSRRNKTGSKSGGKRRRNSSK